MEPNINILNSEGISLSAKLFLPDTPANYLVILCHGFRGNKENHNRLQPFAQALMQQKFAVLAFDFTGCGESEGDFASITLTRQYQDLKAVMDWAQSCSDLPLILLGRSFGGSTILSAAQDSRIKGLIFWSAAIHLVKTFRSSLGSLYDELVRGNSVSWEENGESNELYPSFVHDLEQKEINQNFSALASKTVLIIQGTSDSVVTPDNATFLKGQVPQAELVMVPKADHSFTGLDELREDLTLNWLMKNFSVTSTGQKL